MGLLRGAIDGLALLGLATVVWMVIGLVMWVKGRIP